MSSKTIFPGMTTSEVNNRNNPTNLNTGNKLHSENDKPMMGVLFSVSKSILGECWPVYLGSNSIGSDPSNTVQLSEASVSGRHASLVIRKMVEKGEDKGYFIFIKDEGSTCGTQVNGVTLNLNPIECKSGDVITFGSTYELYFVFFDTEAIGIAPKEEFAEKKPQATDAAPISPMVREGLYAGNSSKGTISVSSSPFDSKKTTIYMPDKK